MSKFQRRPKIRKRNIAQKQFFPSTYMIQLKIKFFTIKTCFISHYKLIYRRHPLSPVNNGLPNPTGIIRVCG